jgi:predicted ATPase/transcriptional regulator with XRE-family HTH domain
MSATQTFGGWLRRQRQERGVTQNDLARDLGFSAALLRKLEAGERRPTDQVGALLAAYYHIPADERAAFVAFARTGQAMAGALAPEPGAGAPPAPWRRAYRLQTNLPAQPTPLIGRARDVAVAHDELRRPRTRLLTITGPPGIGKTRLALHVAAGLLADFVDGVYFVDLAPVRDPALVLPRVARTLGLKEAGERPLAQALLDHVAGRRMLLLLDNFEQVLDAAPAVAQLLAAGPWLKALVTSREALGLRGERRLPIPPLDLPDPEQALPLAQLSAVPAVALFVERAQSVDPQFALTEANTADVVAICIALAGAPLAIELAAARVRRLAPPAMRAALSSHLQLLTGGARDLPARHQTIRAAIAWSYDLLAAPDQRLFRALGAFVGGFTAEAVDAIRGGRPDTPVSTADTLWSLTEKHLIQPGWEGAPLGAARFGLPEAVRESALEQLAAHGESAAIERAHSAYYLALAEEAEPYLWGPEPALRLNQLESERDNLRAALRWALAHDPAAALRAAAALWSFWHVRGYWSEGRAQLAAALAAAAELPPDVAGRERARALFGAGLMALTQGDAAAARDLLEQSLALGRACPDPLTVIRALRTLGHAVYAFGLGDLRAALGWYEQSVIEARALGDARNIAMGLVNLGNVALARGDYPAAQALLADALTQFQALGDARNSAILLGDLGWLAAHEGDYPTACALLAQSLAFHHEHGDKGFILDTMGRQGYVALWQGDYAAAGALAAQCLALSRELGDPFGTFNALLNLGSVAAAAGNHEAAIEAFRGALGPARAVGGPLGLALCLAGLGGAMIGPGTPGGMLRGARLLAAAEPLLRAHWETVAPWARGEHEGRLAAARAALGDAAFATAFAAGQALPLEEAVAPAGDG